MGTPEQDAQLAQLRAKQLARQIDRAELHNARKAATR